LDNFYKKIGHDLPTQEELPATITVLGEEQRHFIDEGL
jgi:hypothetical protein